MLKFLATENSSETMSGRRHSLTKMKKGSFAKQNGKVRKAKSNLKRFEKLFRTMKIENLPDIGKGAKNVIMPKRENRFSNW